MTEESKQPIVEIEFQEEPAKSDNKKSKRNEQKPAAVKKIEFNFDIEGLIEAEGVLEIMQDGYGFLRSSDYNYLNSLTIYTFPNPK